MRKVLIKIFPSLQQAFFGRIRQSAWCSITNSWKSQSWHFPFSSFLSSIFSHIKNLHSFYEFRLSFHPVSLTLMTSLESLGSFRRRKVGCSEETLKIFSSPSKTCEGNCANKSENVSHKCFRFTQHTEKEARGSPEKCVDESSTIFHLFFPVSSAFSISVREINYLHEKRLLDATIVAGYTCELHCVSRRVVSCTVLDGIW